MGRQQELSQAYLKSILHYDPLTGIFTWLVDRYSQKVKGKRAGGATTSRGYSRRRIQINGVLYNESRLAFVWMTGSCPALVDHENLDATDNRWKNIREATVAQNNANRNVQLNNVSGIKGVSWDSGRAGTKNWKAGIGYLGKWISLGRYYTKEEASKAYADKSLELFGEFARIN